MFYSVVIMHLSVIALLAMHLAFVDGVGDETLRFVTIVHRHGARNPVSTYENDPYKNTKWTGGLGSLTPAGSVQLFTLGKHFRRKYAHLLPHDGFYSKKNMQIFSSAEDRCIMSVESLLASFLAPSTKMNPLKVAWQPAAITTIPLDRDNILFQVASSCPKYDAIFRKLMSDPDPDTDIYKFVQKHSDLIKYISKHTGENITSLLHIVVIHDALEVHRDAKLKLPAWTESIFPDKMAPLKARIFQLFTETPYMRRIKGGLLITDIADQMAKKQRGEISQNIFIYSAHDLTLVNMLRGLNVTDQTNMLPKYGASLVFELHCDDEQASQHPGCIVKVFYYSDSNDRDPKLLTIPNCAHPCSLGGLQNSISDVSLHLSEYDEACKLN